jgi:hypothetical protein
MCLVRDNHNVLEPVLDYLCSIGRAQEAESGAVREKIAIVRSAWRRMAPAMRTYFEICEYDERVNVASVCRAAAYISTFMDQFPRALNDEDIDHIIWRYAITFVDLTDYHMKFFDYGIESDPDYFARTVLEADPQDDPFRVRRHEPIFTRATLHLLITMHEPFTYALDQHFVSADVAKQTALDRQRDTLAGIAGIPGRPTLHTFGVHPIQTTEWTSFVDVVGGLVGGRIPMVPCTYTGIASILFPRPDPAHEAYLHSFTNLMQQYGDGRMEAHNAITVYVLQRVSELLSARSTWNKRAQGEIEALIRTLSQYQAGGRLRITTENSNVSQTELHKITTGGQGGLARPSNSTDEQQLYVPPQPIPVEGPLPVYPPLRSRTRNRGAARGMNLRGGMRSSNLNGA